jgi:hypothetical protein
MTLVLASIAFGFGWWCCSQWGSHRAKYYEKQLRKAIRHCEGLKDANEVLLGKMARLEAMGIKEDPESLMAKIDRGILNGIEYMQQKVD